MLLQTLQILIADDDVDAVELYRATLEARGHVVTITLDGQECVNAYTQTSQRFDPSKRSTKDQPYDVVILDYKMPVVDGLEVAKEIIRLNPQQRIIFASAYVKETLMDSVRELNQVTELIQKPFEPDVLVELVENVQSARLVRNLKALAGQINDSSNTKAGDEQMKVLLETLHKIQGIK